MILKCRFRYVLVVGGKGIGYVVKQCRRNCFPMNELVNNIFHRVHSADKIRLCEVKIALIVYRIKVTKLQNRLFHLGKIRSVSRFVAERPEADTGVASVTQNHHLCPVNYCRGPKRIVAGYILSAYTVTFNVALVHYIKAKLVTELIEERIVRIMTGSYGIDVGLFH